MRAWKRRKVFPGLFLFALASVPLHAQSVAGAKQPFVSSLIQFLENIPGTFGDERARISTAIDGMDAGLRGWDEAIRAYAAAAPAPLALGAVQLDRGRTAAAIAAFTEADAPRLRALAHEVAGQAPAAATDFLDAWKRGTQDPADAYLYLFHRRAGDPAPLAEQAAALLTAFANAQADRGAGRAAPFLRMSLLDAGPVSEPVFLPARYVEAARQLRAHHYDAVPLLLRNGWVGDPLNVDPAAAAPAMQAAAAAFRDGRWNDAIAGFEALARDVPASSEARRLLGTVYWLNDDTARSVAQLRAAIAVDPRDERSRITLADVLADDNQVAEAEKVLRQIIADMPASGQAHWRLARLLETGHQDADALREREMAITLAPLAGEGRALAAIARGYAAESNLPRAAAAARARVAVDLNDAAAHEQLGQFFLQQGRENDALIELTVASLLDPERAATQASLAQIHLGAGRYAEAISAAGRAIAKDPKNREARFALARALLQTGDDVGGKSELAAAEQLQVEELERVRQAFATNLIRIEASQREQEEKWDEAARLRREVAARPAATAEDFVLLGKTLSKAGRHDEAIDVLREALRREEAPDTYRVLIRELTTAGRTAEAQTTRATYQRIARERFLR